MRKIERIAEDYLVILAQQGNRAALGKLADLRGPRLLAHATRLLCNREEARDAVQDAWVEILRGLPSLTEPRAFAAWAMRIVTRRCARDIRGKQRQRQLAAEYSADVETTTEPKGGKAADAQSVRNAIAALPPEQAATIALFYLEDMSVAEVSVALDVPQGTVKTRLMHARAKLYNTFERSD
ncbi:MAG: RNA polymerase sigma factor [Albidovulum sp.]